MATPGMKQLGITPPLSQALPTEAENQASTALIEELKRQNNYETPSATQKRTNVLKSLQDITEKFVKIVLRAQGMSEQVINSAGGRIFTYGSFRLGVYGPGSDIDTLVVAPRSIKKEDYFKYFPDLLLKEAKEGSITDLTPVVDAFVPIIKFEYDDISIDLIFSRLDLSQVPRELTLQDKDLLRGLNETELRSLNGTRVTDEILELVPEQGVFRTALRGIKLWAQKRAIYANIMGFPGGVAWAMLVARVCQLYPKATSSTVILKFFRIMEKWPWPSPVLLKPIESGPLPVRVWNPRIYKSDSYHIMPIITPAYPSMCATHNITRSTKEIIGRELKRGGNITDQIMAVESKVRLLVVNLESHESIAVAHPFNKGFDRVHKCTTDEEIEKAKSGSLEYQVKDVDISNLTLNPNVRANSKEESKNDMNGEQKQNGDTRTMVYTTTYYIGLELQEGAKSLDLSWQVEDFKRMCTSWEKHDKEHNALNVAHTRNCELPDDVFTEGEIKPTRPQKKKTTGTRKRVATEDSTPASAKRHQAAVG
ncbi:hypothetical protein B7494_g5988 [Chlorociboria aeruginascens]|nr:hypothetical protein B7494_g5988 [Chlorociboria aeruginascens]